jgi:hypothetical protein
MVLFLAREDHLERIERYVITRGVNGVIVKMRQGKQASRLSILSLAVVLVSAWFGPYGPQPMGDGSQFFWFYWMWSGFFLLILVLGFFGAFYQEDWSITEQAIVVTKALAPWRSTRQFSRAPSLGIRIEIIDDAVFPYRLRFLDAARTDSGLTVELQQTKSVDQFLDALRQTLTLNIEVTGKKRWPTKQGRKSG